MPNNLYVLLDAKGREKARTEQPDRCRARRAILKAIGHKQVFPEGWHMENRGEVERPKKSQPPMDVHDIQTPQLPAPACPFKVGDIVEVIALDGPEQTNWVKIGQRGKVTQVHPKRIDIDELGEWTPKDYHRLRKVEDVPARDDAADAAKFTQMVTSLKEAEKRIQELQDKVNHPENESGKYWCEFCGRSWTYQDKQGDEEAAQASMDHAKVCECHPAQKKARELQLDLDKHKAALKHHREQPTAAMGRMMRKVQRQKTAIRHLEEKVKLQAGMIHAQAQQINATSIRVSVPNADQLLAKIRNAREKMPEAAKTEAQTEHPRDVVVLGVTVTKGHDDGLIRLRSAGLRDMDQGQRARVAILLESFAAKFKAGVLIDDPRAKA